MADADPTAEAFDYEQLGKAALKIRNRTELKLSSDAGGARKDFQRTRYAANDGEQEIKTYSAGTAASQVHYEGAELRIIDDDEEPEAQPVDVVVSGRSHVNRSTKRLDNRISSGGHRPRSICSSGELVGKGPNLQSSDERVTTRSSSFRVSNKQERSPMDDSKSSCGPVKSAVTSRKHLK